MVELSTGDFENFIVLALSDGPLTREELFARFLRFSTKYRPPSQEGQGRLYSRERVFMDSSIDRMVQQGLVTVDEGGVCRLTDEGGGKAARLKGGSGNYAGMLTSYMNRVKTASGASLFADALLAVLKLAVGFTFNCMGLVADGIGTLVNVLSVGAVSLGGRFRKEFCSMGFIIAVMFAAAAFVGYEAVRRLFEPQTVETGGIVMIAALMSGMVCYIMSIYQHAVGRNSGSLSLISRSRDSRNEVFVSIAVLAGIICAMLGVFIVDSLVGLAIAAMILKSAIALTAEMVEVASGGEGFHAGLGRRYLRSWMLFILKEAHSREGIASEFEESFSVEGLPITEHFGFAVDFDFESYMEALLGELVAEGLVTAREDGYYLTDRGRRVLGRKLAFHRYAPG